MFRLFRLIKVYRLLRDFGIRKIKDAIVKERADTACSSCSSSPSHVGVRQPRHAIESQSAVSNITTAPVLVHGGHAVHRRLRNQYPVTTQGRVLGAFVIAGVGLRHSRPSGELLPLLRRTPGQLSDTSQLDAIKELSAQQQEAIATLEESLASETCRCTVTTF